ncbi:ATP-dependent DNA helicase UvrD/PcrA [Clostridiaceae bacterium JG1575]|nr:ATP-dependent DNA helicase UvrD/PcrA [Clostridiaceae bacterium JG1575]
MERDYQRLLNKEQYEACTTVDGPVLILAGAGSGKTRAITHRIAYMIGEVGVPPWAILAITFTNKAANEMKERVRDLVGPEADGMWISTFHSSCVRILRRNIDRLGYRKDFTIYDSYDQKALIRQCMQELKISNKEFSEKDMLSAISSAKDSLITPAAYAKLNSTNFRKARIVEVYERYQRRLKQNSALDFDDIIMLTVQLFQQEPEVLAFYQTKFRYIMVDEYQDTNHAQYQFIRLLSAAHQNICVVGDDDQSIYRFRGADLGNILGFESDYPSAKVIKLEENYRSTETILKAANSVIQNNQSRKKKTMRTANPMGEKIRIYEAFSDAEEGKFVAKEVRRLFLDGRQYKEFALLYRTNAQSRIFEESLMREGIPYRIVGGLKFYDRKEIKDVMAYLRLLNNPFDEVSLRRIINVPKRSIGDVSVQKLADCARSREENMYDVLLDLEDLALFSGRTLISLIEFRDLLNNLMVDAAEFSVRDTLLALLERTQYLKAYETSKDPEDQSRIENVDELLNAAAEYDQKDGASLAGFLEEVALISDVDRYDENADALVLMTVHSAKGLEFPVVFMVGMENGLFPGHQAFDEPGEMEEARRLAYVGITRARELLYMTHAEMRRVFGRSVMYPPSNFIADIPEELKEALGNTKPKMSRADRAVTDFGGMHGLSRPAAPTIRTHVEKGLTPEEVKAGTKVSHPKFGHGMVVGVTKESNDTKVQIVFDNYGIKTFMLSLTPLKLLLD